MQVSNPLTFVTRKPTPSRIDALACAIANQTEPLNTGSESFMTKNPGLLKGTFKQTQIVEVNENGTRIFRTFEAGWQALISNLQMKCQGKTGAVVNDKKICSDSSLKDLITTFSYCYIKCRPVVEFLQDALDDRAISESTPLRFFVEG